MSNNVQHGIEDVLVGRPQFDDPHWYTSVHETIREHRKPSTIPMVVLCFDCMESPRRDEKQIGTDNNDQPIYDRPLRCDGCEYKHERRIRAASKAQGGY